MGRKHRVAVVGLGMAHKPHLQSLRELNDRAEIAVCCAPSRARREDFQRRRSRTCALQATSNRSLRTARSTPSCSSRRRRPISTSSGVAPRPASTCSSRSRSRSRSSGHRRCRGHGAAPACGSAWSCSIGFGPLRAADSAMVRERRTRRARVGLGRTFGGGACPNISPSRGAARKPATEGACS